MQTSLNLPDLSCGHCEKAVTEALAELPGVTSVKVSLAEKRVQVEYDDARVSLDRIADTLREEGYPPAF
ncbi:MAG: cation transporter [Candidatus Eremiobacterota bacterium]